jgi:hypothetical protein
MVCHTAGYAMELLLSCLHPASSERQDSGLKKLISNFLYVFPSEVLPKELLEKFWGGGWLVFIIFSSGWRETNYFIFFFDL